MVQNNDTGEMEKDFTPFVSVVIPTYNRSGFLIDTVKCFLEQDYSRFEIVIVDQTESISSEVREFFMGLNEDIVRYLHLDRPGLTNARNVGIETAQGEIMLFVDDDVTPQNKDFIKHHVKNYSDSDILGVTGRIMDRRYPETSDASNTLRLRKWGAVTLSTNAIVRTQIDVLAGGNMSFRRSTAIDAGNFSENIIGSAEYEDMDFSLRLRKNREGLFIFDPQAALFHHAASSGGCDSRSISPLQRHVWRFHNLTLISLQNRDLINPFLFFLGRLVASLRIAIQLRSLASLYWLAYAMLLGFRTYKDESPPEEAIARVKRKV